jgi:hypothetical protein
MTTAGAGRQRAEGVLARFYALVKNASLPRLAAALAKRHTSTRLRPRDTQSTKFETPHC